VETGAETDDRSAIPLQNETASGDTATPQSTSTASLALVLVAFAFTRFAFSADRRLFYLAPDEPAT
jgi:hypothetical protein